MIGTVSYWATPLGQLGIRGPGVAQRDFTHSKPLPMAPGVSRRAPATSSHSCWRPPATSGNHSRSLQAAPGQLWPPAAPSVPQRPPAPIFPPLPEARVPHRSGGKIMAKGGPGKTPAGPGSFRRGWRRPRRLLGATWPSHLRPYSNCPRPRSKVPPPRRRPKVTSGGDQPRLSTPAPTVMNTPACLPRVLRSSFARKSRRFVLPDPYGTPSARCKPRSCTLLQYFPSTGEVSDLHYELYTEFMTPTQ